MMRLTPQEQKAVCLVLFLLLVGWAVKAYRMAHSDRDRSDAAARPVATQTDASEHAQR